MSRLAHHVPNGLPENWSNVAIGPPTWLILVALAAVPWASPPTVVTRQATQDMVVVRVQVRPMQTRLAWEESDGPKCVALSSIRMAAMAAPSSLDFILKDKTRLRARFDRDCQALDFYGDFYVESDEDRICAKKQEIRSRVGGRCKIQRFDRVKPIPVTITRP